MAKLSLTQRMNRGTEAKQVLEFLASMENDMRDEIWASLRHSGESLEAKMEESISCVRGFTYIQTRLQRLIHDGEIASAELEKSRKNPKVRS